MGEREEMEMSLAEGEQEMKEREREREMRGGKKVGIYRERVWRGYGMEM